MAGDDTPQLPTRPMSRRNFFGAAATAAAGTVGTYTFLGRGSDKAEAVPLPDAAGPPDGARLGSHRVIWSVPTEEPLVAFSFDDGPDPELTPRIMDILDRYEVTATFFTVGFNAHRRPDLLADLVAAGHEIGNHTWMHDDLTTQESTEARRSIALGAQAVKAAVGASPRYFRPPRGQLTGTAMRYAAEKGNDIVLWSVGRGDKGTGHPDSIRDHMLGKATSGDIVLLHDGIGREVFRKGLNGPGPLRLRRDVELAALPAIIEGVLDKGLQPVTVSRLLAAAPTAT